MFQNYFKIAVRTLWRDRRYTAVNVFGLAVGLAVCLLMLLLIRQHWRIDRFHDGADRLYRVTVTNADGDRYAASPPPLGPVLQSDYAGVARAVRMRQWNSLFIRGEDSFRASYLQTEPAFFEVFDGFRLAQGEEHAALAEPFSAVLSKDMARKLFGTEDAVGRTFTRKGVGDFTVTGILAERPAAEPSHLDFGILLSYATLEAREAYARVNDWQRLGREYTYLQLEEGTPPAAVEAHLADVSRRFYPAAERARYTFGLQAVAGMAFEKESLWNDIENRAKLPPSIAYALAALALIVLLAAGFNYVNLAVTRSLRRAREIGVRKTVGARREQIAAQFLTEALLTALAATLLAALFLEALVPAFKNLYAARALSSDFAFDLTAEPRLALLLLAFGAGVGLVAGAYPALVLSRPAPVHIFRKGSTGALWRGLWSVNLRKGLMALQFVFAIVLTVAAVLLYRQTTETMRADHGFRTEQVFAVPLADVSYDVFKAEAQQAPGVAGVTGISDPFLGPNIEFRPLMRPEAPGDTLHRVYHYAVDSTFAREMNLRFAARLPDLEKRFASGTGVILNEESAQALGFASPGAALGRPVAVGSVEDSSHAPPLTVAGVARGVQVRGLLNPDNRLVLRYDSDALRYAVVRARGDALEATLDRVGALWERLPTVYPFAPQRFDVLKEQLYLRYRSLAYICGAMALLAVVIAVLGLAALAAYLAQTREKEIGIRKALGASAADVVRLLAGRFVALFAASALVGVPLAWLFQDWMLQPFVHRTAVGWGPFAASVALLGALVAAVAGGFALRAARTNPADALRDE